MPLQTHSSRGFDHAMTKVLPVFLALMPLAALVGAYVVTS
jgi:hypothetical protein